MGTLMTGFKSRRKVNPELIDRYEWNARYHGDKDIKKELSTARRTATSLENSSKQFGHLRPEHKLALEAATSAMRQLSADLSELVGWAKEYGVYCAAEHARQAAAELEAVAEKRWGNDPKALAFEADVVAELSSRYGAVALGHWMHLLGQHLDVKPEDFSIDFDNVHNQESHHQRKVLARIIQGAMGRAPLKWAGPRGMSYSCGWGDYELYLTHRKAAALATEKLLSGFAA